MRLFAFCCCVVALLLIHSGCGSDRSAPSHTSVRATEAKKSKAKPARRSAVPETAGDMRVAEVSGAARGVPDKSAWLEGPAATGKTREKRKAVATDAPDTSRGVSSESEVALAEPMEIRDEKSEADDLLTRGKGDVEVPASETKPDKKPPPRWDTQIQSGTLTAGSFDDNNRYDDFWDFVQQAMRSDTGEVLPRLGLGKRAMIHVTGAGGRPVGGARVVVRPRDWGQHQDARKADRSETELTTGSDGRVVFLTGIDGQGQPGPFDVSVYATDGSKLVSQPFTTDQKDWRLAVPAAAAELPGRLDLSLVIDTTGSMKDELEYLKVEIDSIAEAVHRMFPGVDQRYSLVLYRDHGDHYVTRTFDFDSSLREFRSRLAAQSAAGGGDNPEAVHLALEEACNLDWRKGNTARVLFLVGDAPPHDRDGNRTLEAVKRLREKGVRIYPVAASGAAVKAEFVMRSAAFLTLGQYLFLTDHSGVGNPHAEPHVPDYQVEHLNKLMVRMIASELAGRRLAAGDVLAIEGGQAQPGSFRTSRWQQQQNNNTSRSVVSLFSSIPRWVTLAVFFACVFAVVAVVDRVRR